MHVPGRGDVVIETLGAGAVLGWSWLFPPYRWHFGAVARRADRRRSSSTPRRCARLCDDRPGARVRRSCSRFTPVVVDRLQATRIRLLDLYGPARRPP